MEEESAQLGPHGGWERGHGASPLLVGKRCLGRCGWRGTLRVWVPARVRRLSQTHCLFTGLLWDLSWFWWPPLLWNKQGVGGAEGSVAEGGSRGREGMSGPEMILPGSQARWEAEQFLLFSLFVHSPLYRQKSVFPFVSQLNSEILARALSTGLVGLQRQQGQPVSPGPHAPRPARSPMRRLRMLERLQFILRIKKLEYYLVNCVSMLYMNFRGREAVPRVENYVLSVIRPPRLWRWLCPGVAQGVVVVARREHQACASFHRQELSCVTAWPLLSTTQSAEPAPLKTGVRF